MIVRKLEDIKNSAGDIDTPNWNSRRLLLKDDGMGFSVHDTIIKAGTATEMWYKNHLEAVYCIEGSGEILDLETGKTHPISPGTLYALNLHDRHVLKGFSDMRMVCVFNPPITGREVHDEEGAYPALQES